MHKVAVTGGLASGKSTLCDILEEEFNAKRFDSDKVVNSLLEPETPIGKKIIKLIGNRIIKDGVFDKRAIADRVFTSPTLLYAYEKILHLAVERELLKSIALAFEEHKLFIAEVPLLFESGLEKHFDFVICVHADKKIRKSRSKRFTSEQFERRDQLQLELEEKMNLAHFSVDSTQGIQQMRQQIKTIINKIEARG